MSDQSTLKVGDRIRIVGVPKGDLWALASGATYLEETVRVLEWMVGKEFIIWMIDEDGKPWVEVDYPDRKGAEHSMAIMDSESRVHVRADWTDLAALVPHLSFRYGFLGGDNLRPE